MPYKVTLDNYVDLAGRTEAPITEEIRARVSDPRVAASLLHNLHLFAAVAGWLDKLKKHIFYGKELPDGFFFADQNRATAEVIGRLQDEVILRLLHGVLGIGTEAGELVQDDHKGKLKGILPVLEGSAVIDGWNFLEEVGDVNWYNAQIIRVMDDICYSKATLPDVLQTNIDKLEARYPEKFTEDEAINRDLEAEREILETKLEDLSPFTPGKYDDDLVPAEEN